MVRAWLLLSAISFGGGGSYAFCQQPNNPAPAARALSSSKVSSSRIIVAFGDSITAGYGVDPNQSYPSILEGYLNDHGYRYRVINLGVNGDTTQDGVRRLPEVEKRKPAVTIVVFGANDMLQGLPIAQTRANLDIILSSLLQTGSQVVLGEETLSSDYGANYIQQFQLLFQQLAQKYNVTLVSPLFKDLTGIPGMLQDDRVHATAEGNAQIAHNLVPFLKPLLTRKSSKVKKR